MASHSGHFSQRPSGTRLGVYEVGPPIGEGGMGQVYRATDTTLGRTVAIKIVPDANARTMPGDDLPDHVSRTSDEFVTQVIKADANGVFSYVMPRAGWWGFAALVHGDEQMRNPDGGMVDVELGALIWVRTIDME